MRHLLNMTLLSLSLLSVHAYDIKYPEHPLPHEATAVQELGSYLAKRIQGKLEIGGHSPVVFHIGDTPLAREQHLLSTELPEDMWVVRSFDGQVVLNGGGTRGALYAVYHFLEDICDIHWWSDAEEYIPQPSPLSIPALNLSGKPAFLYRDIYRTNRLNVSPLTAVRNRLNRNGDQSIPKELGGSFNYGPPYHTHTFNNYVPADKYLKEHPEYFSLRKGKRVGGQTTGQLCLTNPALKAIFLENLLKNIEAGRQAAVKAGLPEPRIYDISMNDNRNYCECENCMAFVKEHGHSGLTLSFVNGLAEEVAKHYPDVFLSTLAYFYSEPPPQGGIRAAHNVIVKLCDTTTNQAASILEPENAKFKAFVEQWKNYADHLFIWDYAVTYTHGVTGMPFASEFHLADLYRHYHANHVSGIFWEHEYSHIADMFELKFFLECKLFENPDSDIDQLIRLFMDRYYGPAAPFLLEYRQRLDALRKKNKGFISWFPPSGAFSYITDDDLKDLQVLFDRATDAVRGDKPLTLRVNRARFGLDRLAISRSSSVPFYEKGVPMPSKVNGKVPAQRIKEYWPAWCQLFGEHAEGIKNDIMNSLSVFNYTDAPVPPPEQFKDSNFFDFPAQVFEIHDKKNLKLVKDDTSPVGVSACFDSSGSQYYPLPFEAGYYDRDKQLTKPQAIYPKPLEGRGYNWYHIGKVTIPVNGYIYATRAWTVQVQTAVNALVGKEVDLWISAKFTGPLYYPEQSGDSHIYIDRIIAVAE